MIDNEGTTGIVTASHLVKVQSDAVGNSQPHAMMLDASHGVVNSCIELKRIGRQIDRSATQSVCEQLMQYFAGERTKFELELSLVGTDFQKRAWHMLATIPYGETWSYAELARQVDSPKAVRAVGAANGRNPLPIVLPCHRVIGSNGALTGFGGGLPVKQWLLEHEGNVIAAAVVAS